jgi:multiple sugar transport system permease protein
MAVTAVSGVEIRRPVPRLRRLEDERWLALALLLPTAVLLGLFIAYPFFEGVMLSLSSARVGIPGEFIGLKNFSKIWDDSIFRTSVWNTFWYTGVTTVFKLALGLWLAMLLNRHFRGKALVRAFILLPFIIPTVLSTFAWKWMFDPTFSVINWSLFHLGLITTRINWLGDPDLAMTSIIIVNIWRGVPFFAISLLAGLQTISPELNEAAAIDGARPVLVRHLAAAAASHHGGDAVLGDPDLRRFPARLCHDRRRAGQRHATLRDLRLPDRHRHRPAVGGCRDLARHVPVPVHHRGGAAPLHPPS